MVQADDCRIRVFLQMIEDPNSRDLIYEDSCLDAFAEQAVIWPKLQTIALKMTQRYGYNKGGLGYKFHYINPETFESELVLSYENDMAIAIGKIRSQGLNELTILILPWVTSEVLGRPLHSLSVAAKAFKSLFK